MNKQYIVVTEGNSAKYTQIHKIFETLASAKSWILTNANVTFKSEIIEGQLHYFPQYNGCNYSIIEIQVD